MSINFALFDSYMLSDLTEVENNRKRNNNTTDPTDLKWYPKLDEIDEEDSVRKLI